MAPMNITSFLEEIGQRKLENQPPGIFSICSANPFVLKSCMQLAKIRGFPLLIETTCNQVNQYGGYIHSTPQQFAQYVHKLAQETGLPTEQILLGGDHLGPFVWKNEPAESAMRKSTDLVAHYVRAGYKKIHLDASVACLDDPVSLPKEIVVEREIRLCQAAVAESESLGQDLAELVFVVGTEVPLAGGAPGNQGPINVSSAAETEENIFLTHKAFIDHNLETAWERTLAFVVQPGIEFTSTSVIAYDRQKSRQLSSLIEKYDHLVFEAHSTDYQTRTHLKELVEDHFAILKVGPALTYALREALFALSEIEIELCASHRFELSNLKMVLEKVMVANPEHWANYYSGDEQSLSFQRKYSLLDRSRYYLSHPEMEKSLDKLISNLSSTSIPLSLISQFLPDQIRKVKEGKIRNQPLDLISGKIADVVEDYLHACHFE